MPALVACGNLRFDCRVFQCVPTDDLFVMLDSDILPTLRPPGWTHMLHHPLCADYNHRPRG